MCRRGTCTYATVNIYNELISMKLHKTNNKTSDWLQNNNQTQLTVRGIPCDVYNSMLPVSISIIFCYRVIKTV